MPDHSPRVTQTNIGQYLVEDLPPKETSYGTHYTEYGGIGERDILGKKLHGEPPVPRSHRHFGSGFKQRQTTTGYVHPKIVNSRLERNKACFVDPPFGNAPLLSEIQKKYKFTHEVNNLHRSRLNLFPRPEQMELSYVERANGPRPETRLNYFETCDRLTCGRPQERLGIRHKSASPLPAWWNVPPFWWLGSPFGPPGPVGNPDDYGHVGLAVERLEQKFPPNLREEIQVERPERYIPGQIHSGGPLDTRRPCQCPAVAMTTYAEKSAYPTFRGPGHWPSSAMEERRSYANRGRTEEEERTCPLYGRTMEDGRTSEDVSCPYCGSPSYVTQEGRNASDCVVAKGGVRGAEQAERCVCPVEQGHPVPGVCPCHLGTTQQKKRATCPVEQGRPVTSAGGILSHSACYEAPETERKLQLHKVGLPFRTDACRWYNDLYPSYKPEPVGRSPKKMLPEMRFSNL
ncbi:hypothetical protein ANN_16525 [Periplaneta americana]|uniref:Protein FAM166B n=1 Tax=Periplaneta americana TaxID=6978 RepID=A0ABQ8SQM5_PERAM|nr:hypothetical protein ANN_16525 [Periplaneta americana]